MIYDLLKIEAEIEVIAKDNDGEIPEDLLRQLVESHTSSVQRVDGICKYVRHLELYMSACDEEEKRIKSQRKKAEKRLESIEKFLTPFIKKQGKFDAGTFKLSTRKSDELDIDCSIFEYSKYKHFYHSPKEPDPDKKLIKKTLKSGVDVPGCSLKPKDNLQIK